MESEFGIPQLIFADELINGSVEEKSVVAYVSLCRDVLRDAKAQEQAISSNPHLQKLKDGLDGTLKNYKSGVSSTDKVIQKEAPKKKKNSVVDSNIAEEKFAARSDYKLALASERHIKNIKKLNNLIAENKDPKKIQQLKNAIDEGKKILIENLHQNHKENVYEINIGKDIEKKHLGLPNRLTRKVNKKLKTSGKKSNSSNINDSEQKDIEILNGLLEKQKIPNEVKITAIGHSVIEEIDTILENVSKSNNKEEKKEDGNLPKLLNLSTENSLFIVEKEITRLLDSLKNINRPKEPKKKKGLKGFFNSKKKQNSSSTPEFGKKSPLFGRNSKSQNSPTLQIEPKKENPMERRTNLTLSLVEGNLQDEIQKLTEENLSVASEDKVLEVICEDLGKELLMFKSILKDPIATESQKTNAASILKSVVKNSILVSVSPLKQIQLLTQEQLKVLSTNLDEKRNKEQEVQKYIDKISKMTHKIETNIKSAITDDQTSPFQKKFLKKFSKILKNFLSDHAIEIMNWKKDYKKPLDNVNKTSEKMSKCLKAIYDLCSINSPHDALSDLIKKAKISIEQSKTLVDSGDIYTIDHDILIALQEVEREITPLVINCKVLSLQEKEIEKKLAPIVQKIKSDLKSFQISSHKLKEYTELEVEEHLKKDSETSVIPTTGSENETKLLNGVKEPLNRIKLALEMIPELTKCDIVDQSNKSQFILGSIPVFIDAKDITTLLENSAQCTKFAKSFVVLSSSDVSQKNSESKAHRMLELIKEIDKQFEGQTPQINKIVESRFSDPSHVKKLLENYSSISEKIDEMKQITLALPTQQELEDQKKGQQNYSEPKISESVALLSEIGELKKQEIPNKVSENVVQAVNKLDELVSNLDNVKVRKVKYELNEMIKKLDFEMKGLNDSSADITQQNLISYLTKENKLLNSFIKEACESQGEEEQYKKIIEIAEQMKDVHTLSLRGLNSEKIASQRVRSHFGDFYLNTVPILIPLFDSILVNILKSAMTLISSPQRKNYYRLFFLSYCSLLKRMTDFFISLLVSNPHLSVFGICQDSLSASKKLKDFVENDVYEEQDNQVDVLRRLCDSLKENYYFCIFEDEKKKKIATDSVNLYSNHISQLSWLCLDALEGGEAKEIFLQGVGVCIQKSLSLPNSLNVEMYSDLVKADTFLSILQILLESDSVDKQNCVDLLKKIELLVDSALESFKKSSTNKKKDLIESLEKDISNLQEVIVSKISNESKFHGIQIATFYRSESLKTLQQTRKLISQFFSTDDSSETKESEKVKNKNKKNLEKISNLPKEKIADSLVLLKENQIDKLESAIEEIRESTNYFAKETQNVSKEIPEGEAKEIYEAQMKSLEENLSQLEDSFKNLQRNQKIHQDKEEEEEEGSQAQEDLSLLLCSIEKIKDNIQNLSSPPPTRAVVDKKIDIDGMFDDILSSLGDNPKETQKKLGTLQTKMNELSNDTKNFGESEVSPSSINFSVDPILELQKDLLEEEIKYFDLLDKNIKEASVDDILKDYYVQSESTPEILLPGREERIVVFEESKVNEEIVPTNPTEINLLQRENMGKLLESIDSGNNETVRSHLQKILQNTKKSIDKATKFINKKMGDFETRKKIKDLIRTTEQILNDLSRDAIKSQTEKQNKFLAKLVKSDCAKLNQYHSDLLDMLSDPTSVILNEIKKQLSWQNKALKNKNKFAIEAGAKKLVEQTKPLIDVARNKLLSDIRYSEEETKQKLTKIIEELNELPVDNEKLATKIKENPNENPKKMLENLKENNQDFSDIISSLENTLDIDPIEVILSAYQHGISNAQELFQAITEKSLAIPKYISNVHNYYHNAIKAINQISNLEKEKKKKLTDLSRKLDDNLTKFLGYVKYYILHTNKSEEIPELIVEKMESKADKNHNIIEKVLQELKHRIPSEKLELFDQSSPVFIENKNEPSISDNMGMDTIDNLLNEVDEIKPRSFTTPVPNKEKGSKIAKQKIKNLKKKHGDVIDAVRRKEEMEKIKQANENFKDAVNDTISTMQSVAYECDDPLSKKELERNLKNFEEILPVQEELFEKFLKEQNNKDRAEIRELNSDITDLIKELEDLNLENDEKDEFSDLQNLLGNGDIKLMGDTIFKGEEESEDSSDGSSSDDEDSSYESGDSVDDELLHVVENTRNYTNYMKSAANNHENKGRLQDLLEIIDELEDFVPKMIGEAPKLKESAMEGRRDPKKMDQNKDILKNFEFSNLKLEKVLDGKSDGINKGAKSEQQKLKRAFNNSDEEELEEILKSLSGKNNNYLENAKSNLKQFEIDESQKSQVEDLIRELEEIMPEQENIAKEKVEKLKEKKNYRKSKFVRQKEETYDYDETTSSSHSEDEDEGKLADITTKIEENMNDISLLFPDLQLTGDVDLLLANLNDPNFGVVEDKEEIKKDRRKRRTTVKFGLDEDILKVPIEGSIRLRTSEWNKPELDLSFFDPLLDEQAFDPLSARTRDRKQTENFGALDFSDFMDFQKLPESKLEVCTIDFIDVGDQFQKLDNLNSMVTPSQAKELKMSSQKAKIVKPTSHENIKKLIFEKIPKLLNRLKAKLDEKSNPLKLDVERFVDLVSELIKLSKVVSASLEDQEQSKYLDSISDSSKEKAKEFIFSLKYFYEKKGEKEDIEKKKQVFLDALEEVEKFYEKMDPGKQGATQLKEIIKSPYALEEKNIEELLNECQVVSGDILEYIENPIKQNSSKKLNPTNGLDNDRFLALLIMLYLLHHSMELKLKKNSETQKSICEIKEKLSNSLPEFIDMLHKNNSKWKKTLESFEKLMIEDEELIENVRKSLLVAVDEKKQEEIENNIKDIEEFLVLDEKEEMNLESNENAEESKDKISENLQKMNKQLLEALKGDAIGFDVMSFSRSIIIVVKHCKTLLISIRNEDQESFNTLKTLSEDLVNDTILLIKCSKLINSVSQNEMSEKEMENMKLNFFDIVNKTLSSLEILNQFIIDMESNIEIDIKTDEETCKIIEIVHKKSQQETRKINEEAKFLLGLDLENFHKAFTSELQSIYSQLKNSFSVSKKDVFSVNLKEIYQNISKFFTIFFTVSFNFEKTTIGKQFLDFVKEKWVILVLEWYIHLKSLASNRKNNKLKQNLSEIISNFEKQEKQFESFFVFEKENSSSFPLFIFELSRLKKGVSIIEKCQSLLFKEFPEPSVTLEDYKKDVENLCEDFKKTHCEVYVREKTVEISNFEHTPMISSFVKIWKYFISGILILDDGKKKKKFFCFFFLFYYFSS